MEVKNSTWVRDGNGGAKKVNHMVCYYWLAGRCNRNPCRFLHIELHQTIHHQVANQFPKNCWRRNLDSNTKNSSISTTLECSSDSNQCHKNTRKRNSIANPKSNPMSSSCSSGHGFFKLAELNGHTKAISGIVLPSGSEKLYTASGDGCIRVWDCHSGQCGGVLDLGGEIGSLISAGPWLFAGQKNVVKAWNIHSRAEFTLDGPTGQVHSMVVDNDKLFVGAQNGNIYTWKFNSETKGLELVWTLTGHNGAVVSLAIGGRMLYSGSTDSTIRVWDLDAFQCTQILKDHVSAVTSLVCWGPYLISCSLDQTIKVWFGTEENNLEVTYTHNEEQGVLALFGMNDSEARPILFCSCKDNSVRLYELPSFVERGRILAKQEIREIQSGCGEVFFTGDGSGQVDVWKWQESKEVCIAE